MAQPSFFRDLGPCDAYWNSERLGPTHGGVGFTYTQNAADIHEDGQGVALVDSVFTGATVESVEVPLTRVTLAELAHVTEGATVNEDGNLVIGNVVGVSMYELAQVLLLRPMVNNVPSEDEEEFLTFHKAYPVASWEIGYNLTDQRVFKVLFKVFPKQETPYLGDFMKCGSSEAEPV